MGFAVELYFDPASSARVQALWQALARQKISSRLPDIGSRPHISLAVFNHLDPGRLQGTLNSFAATTTQREVSLSAIGSFPSSEGVIYLAPIVTTELLTIHADFHQRLATLDIPSIPYYHPGSWIPHCTVASDLPSENMAAAFQLCRESDVFHPIRLVEVGLIAYRPVRPIYTFPLPLTQSYQEH